MPEFPADILAAMTGECPPTVDQLRRMIEVEAKVLGLSFADAIERARLRTLPRNAIGADLSLLVEMLPAA